MSTHGQVSEIQSFKNLYKYAVDKHITNNLFPA